MNSRLKSRLLSSSIAVSVALSAYSANAQIVDPDADGDDDVVIVTGSRIAKQDFVSNSPVATVDSLQLELTNTVNTEELLNTLPQTVPGFDRTSNNPGGGFATVDLRGLGTARTLVLVDGQRMVPTTGGGTVDINNIPPALIERVEVVTGGASAVYGSDAVAGVVNFILRDDFEGAELASGYRITEEGDANLLSLSATIGTNFDDDRGNVVAHLGYTDRQEVFQGDRDFSFFDLSDDGNGGLRQGGSSGIPQGRLSGVFPGQGSGAALFNPDGTIRLYTNDDSFNFAPVNYLQLPQERIQFNTLADYEVTDKLSINASALYTSSEVPQQLAPTPIFEPRGGTIQVSLDGNPFIDPSAQQTISDSLGSGVDTDGDGIDDEFTAGAFGIRRRLLEVGPRIANNDFNTFQLKLGAEYELTDNFTADVNFIEGRTSGTETQSGNINKDRFFQALRLADADGDGNVDVDANGNPTCADTGANGGLVGCAPINIYGEGNISPEAADFIRTLANIDTQYDQTIVTANIAGNTDGMFELPGGPIGIAIGGEYREEEYFFAPSQDVAASTISGFNGAPPVAGGFDVYGAYGELYLPLVADLPFMDLFAIELAGRVEDYSTAGTVESYKIAGEWATSDQLRFRASYNTAVRAPSITELFQPQGEGFPTSSDPCASGFNGDAALRAVCEATGVPTANVGSAAIDLPSNQVRQISGGNPNLFAEEAETLTIGFVARPEPIPGLTLTVDYFDIRIDDVISAFGGGANNVISTCYTNAELGGAGSPFCNAITRGSDGLITEVSVTSQNVASLDVEGLDVQADYSIDTDFGLFGINYLGTLTEENTLVSFEGDTPIECAGEFGGTCGTPIPRYTHRMTGQYGLGDFTAQLLWRHVGPADDDGSLAGVRTVDRIGSQNYFNASGSYDINDTLRLTVGVDNLTDNQPPVLGNNDQQANTYPALYDVFGRTYFARATARF